MIGYTLIINPERAEQAGVLTAGQPLYVAVQSDQLWRMGPLVKAKTIDPDDLVNPRMWRTITGVRLARR
jgi:hypothetical protein